MLGGAVFAGLRVWWAKMLTMLPSVPLGMGRLFRFLGDDALNESARQRKAATMVTHRRPLVCYASFTASLFAAMARFAPQFCCADAPSIQPLR